MEPDKCQLKPKFPPAEPDASTKAPKRTPNDQGLGAAWVRISLESCLWHAAHNAERGIPWSQIDSI